MFLCESPLSFYILCTFYFQPSHQAVLLLAVKTPCVRMAYASVALVIKATDTIAQASDFSASCVCIVPSRNVTVSLLNTPSFIYLFISLARVFALSAVYREHGQAPLS